MIRAAAAQRRFQFTPPRGGRPSKPHTRIMQGLFQFTPPRGGRLVLISSPARSPIFQFTPPRGGRHILARCQESGESNFNSRPRVGGDVFPCSQRIGRTHFNSRPRVGGDCLCQLHNNRMTLCISIHAPAWGATLCLLRQKPLQRLFQFTPPRGGRHPCIRKL